MSYEAFVLTPESRAQILSQFPPKYETVAAHHVTHRFGVPEGTSTKMVSGRKTYAYGLVYSSIQVVGYADNGGIEALVVEVLSESHRPDGKRYHITLSYDPTKHKPADSNKLLAGDLFEHTDNRIVISGTFEYL